MAQWCLMLISLLMFGMGYYCGRAQRKGHGRRPDTMLQHAVEGAASLSRTAINIRGWKDWAASHRASGVLLTPKMMVDLADLVESAGGVQVALVEFIEEREHHQ